VPSAREQRIWIDDPSVLSRYLPDAVVHHLLEANATHSLDIDLGPHVARLQNLLQFIVSYVPEHAEASRRAHPAERPGYINQTQGTLLAADLSGFTAFSARLGTLGSEGAELVARTVNALFSTLLDVLGEWGGSLLKLSGDALTALFSGPDHVRRAAAAGLELQRHMEAFQSLSTPAGVFTLSMRIGLASGNVLLVEIGSAQHVELLVAGATAQRVMELQRQATPGTVVIGPATYQQIETICQVATVSSRLYQLLAIEPIARPTDIHSFTWVSRRDLAWELHALVGRIAALRPYLVDQHFERMADGPPGLLSEGDLRPVTVLFACLSDIGTLLERAAPGDADPALIRVQAAAERLWAIVEQYGGTINKVDIHYEGHTLIVLFGAPIAQRRAAERAVSCALALLRDLGIPQGALANDMPALHVHRVGIATGRVFAGAVGSANRREYTVMGSVVNLAARLMDVANEGQALLDSATARLVERLVRLQKRPPVLVKGYDQPVPFYVIVREQQSFVGSVARQPTPLLGRTAELAQANAVIAQALAGRGRIVALVGEAGIGKSRLLAEIVAGSLVAHAGDPTIIAVLAQPHSRVQPYSLIAEGFRQLYNLPAPAESAASALIAEASQAASDHERFLPLLPTLFGRPCEDRALVQALTPSERRARLSDLIVALLLSWAETHATALVLEDLHWADSASIEVLGALMVAARARPLLLLGTYRPEHAPAWPAEAALTRIDLPALTPEQSQALISILVGAPPLSAELRAAVVERTLGNPFFIEEMIRTVRDRNLSLGAEPPLPASIHSALLERLDQLSLEERFVLQVASVIGPLFQRSLLAGVAGERVALDQALDRLSKLALVRQVGEDDYSFAHSLTQETAYESLLFAQRRDMHRQIADCLRASSAEQADPGVLAHHYRRAEAWPEALENAWQAGQRAQSLYAGDIALGHYQQALEAAERIDGTIAAQRYPSILRRIGDIHTLAGRYADAIAAYETALASSGDDHERAEVLISWAAVYEQQASYDDALALLDQAASRLAADDPLALRIAVRRGYALVRHGAADQARAAIAPCLELLELNKSWPDLLLAYRVFFLIAYGQSRWSEARSYLRLALTYAEQIDDIREIARINNNLGVVLGQEGNLQEAARSFERASHVMEEIADRYNLASVQINTGVIYYRIGDFDAALRHYNAGLRVAITIGDPYHQGIARSNLGELYRQLGQLSESHDQLQQSIELYQQTNDESGLSEAYCQLAETFLALDRVPEAERACEQACAIAIAAGDPQAEAISYRVQSMLAIRRGDLQSALIDARRSVSMLTELGSTYELGQSMIAQATVLMYTQQPEAAYDVLMEAIRLMSRAGATVARAEAEKLLNQAREQTKEAEL